MIVSSTLHNAPPSHGQVTAVAVIFVLVVLFAVVFFAVLFTVLRRDRIEERLAELERRAAA